MANQPRDAARQRPLLKKAIFGGPGGKDPGADGKDPADEDPEVPPARAVTGTVLDASPHILVVATEPGAEERFALTGSTSAWRGGAGPPPPPPPPPPGLPPPPGAPPPAPPILAGPRRPTRPLPPPPPSPPPPHPPPPPPAPPPLL